MNAGNQRDEILIAVHGSDSEAEWQRQVHSAFRGMAGFHHYSFCYQPPTLWKIVSDSFVSKEVLRFLERYGDLQAKHDRIAPSIVAHGFGAHIVAEAITRYRPNVCFDRLVLIGSIVDRQFDWPSLIKEGKVREVLNQTVAFDSSVNRFKSPIARWLLPGTGTSGMEGFAKEHTALHEEHFDGIRLSAQLISSHHCKRSWIPFLRGTKQFAALCERCLDSEQDWRAALQQFDTKYGPRIEGWGDTILGKLRLTREQMNDCRRLIRQYVIQEGRDGREKSETIIERQVVALYEAILFHRQGS